MQIIKKLFINHSRDGQIAQLVEQRTENPRVGGSIPSLATTWKLSYLESFFYLIIDLLNMAILGGVEFAMLIRTGAHKLLAYRHTPVCLSLVVELTVVSSNPLSLFLYIKKLHNGSFWNKYGALGGVRTHNLLIRSQMLYPVELRVRDWRCL